jgi:hypothetical protein
MHDIDDGSGFDFLLGTWAIANHRLVDALDPGCETWVDFAATGVAQPILHGRGNVDTFSVPALPGGGGSYEGFTLRLFDPVSGRWRIWWSSTARPGRLDPPVEGRFRDGEGVFEADDEVDGVALRMRFVWDEIAADAARWTQSFSFDGGTTWKRNWEMRFTRTGDRLSATQLAGSPPAHR